MSAPQPCSRSQRDSATMRSSWPPNPRDASVWRIVGMATDYRRGARGRRNRCGRASLPAAAARTAATAAGAAAIAAAAAGGLGLLDQDRPAVEVRAVQAADGLLGLLGRRHLDEPKAARPARSEERRVGEECRSR